MVVRELLHMRVNMYAQTFISISGIMIMSNYYHDS